MSKFDGFFNPKNIAVIGATDNPDDVNFLVLENLKMTFQGEIYPINPNFTEILGLNCFPSVGDVEEKIDLALILVPKEEVKNQINNCIKKKIEHAIIFTKGFSDIEEKEARLDLIKTSKGKIRLIGPNSLGIFKSTMDMLFVSRKKLKRPPEGYLTFITDSGTLSCAIMDILANRNIGVSKFISLGNKWDVNEIEMLEYLEKDLNTRCIAIYTENIEKGKEFIDLAKKIIKKKPIIILKGNKINTDQNENNIYSAAFKQANIIEAETTEDFLDFSRALSNQPFMDTNNLGILTNCDGFGTIAADAAVKLGLNISDGSKDARKKIKNAIPEYKEDSNLIILPSDTTAETYETVLTQMMKDKMVSGVLCISLMQLPSMDDDLLNVLREAKIYGKPLVACLSAGQYSLERAKKLEALGIPVYVTPERAIRALKVLYDYGQILKK